ncbi:peptidase [Gardnerella vaginalis]|uniref:peptidase n=2 Tax=Gardnerella vaginalis TaxID=2702 RepID=UPI0039EE595B
MVSKSRKHARTVKLNSAVNNAIEKAVDARKVAAFTVGAAGVIAGAAFAFGATPAMAAEAGVAPDTKPAPVTAGEKPGADAGKADAKPEAKEADKNNQTEEKSATDEKADNNTLEKADKTLGKQTKFEQNLSKEKKASTQSVVKADGTETEQNTVNTESVDNKVTDITSAENVSRKRTKRALENNQPDATAPESRDRASNGDIKEVAFSSQTGEMPNVYGFGTVDNQYDEQLANNPITFKLPKQKDDNGADKAVTRVTVFPSPSNHINTPRTSGSIDFDSDNNGHQPYSGEYVFNKNNDGSATLTMNRIFRKDERGDSKGIKNAQGYSATRSIQINPTPIPGSAKEDAVSDQFRAALLVPPKSAGTIVKKVSDIAITENDVNNAMDDAKKNGKTTHVGKSGIDGLSLEKQIQALSNKLGKRKLDTIDEKIPTRSNEYDKSALTKANSKVGVSIVDTHFVTDLGFKSQAIPLTIVRYDDVIDKPIVEDPNNLSQDVKNEIAQKLAKINGVTPDKITFDNDGNAVINFDGVDTKDAPKIKLSELVLKKLEEKDISVPAESTATVIYNPLAYSDAEIARIKKAIYEANKDKTELGLSATDYEKQITLSYLTGNLTATGHANQGISNGQAENIITVKIKTDKAVAEFKSDVKAHKLTRLADIRKDYTVSWTKDKIDGRGTDEGFSWSEDGKTIIYRYDSTKAEEFDTNKILDLLKATAKDKNSGLRDLTGNEKLDHEGVDGKGKKSHVGYVIKDDQPTTELSLGNMSGANWQYSQKVDNSGVDLGDNLSEAGSYSWDNDAKPVFVAAKKGKVYKARLFVLPYGLTMYRNVYMENGNQPWNTPKAINVIFVPQTNHKTNDLKTSIGEHKTVAVEGKDVPTQSAYYNASDKVKSDYDDALKVAKALYEQVKDKKESDLTEKQKADIDNATIKLDKARAALDGAKTNKDGLDKSITEDGAPAQGQNPASGTQATDRYKNVNDPDFKKDDGSDDTDRNNAAKEAKKAYDKALEDAKTLKADENATQKAVDEAKAKLDAAREKLNEFSTNKDELSAAIAKDGKVNTGEAGKTGDEKLKTADPTYQNSTKEEREAYDKAVAEADKVSKDPEASQKEVNEAIKKLKEAKSKLDANATDKSKLAAAEKQSFDNPSTDASKQSTFYKNALNKKDNGASEQEKQAADQAIKNYDQALANARTILNNEKATQAQVDEAKKKLEEAEKALHENYKSDDNDLTKAIANNVSGYLMPAYFNAFDQAQKDGADSQAAKDFKAYNDAYQKAKELSKKLKETEESKKPKQTEIDAAKTALEDARKVIDKYATDTSKISAALLHSLAIKASPAYKNASATDATEDAKNAAKAYDDALKELQKAFNDNMDKDKGDDGSEIPESVIPDKNIDMTNKDALKKLQAHAKGQPLNRDVTKLLAKLNDAVKGLDKFKTQTDELIKSVNEDAATHQNPAFKNASHPDYKQTDGTTADTTKNDAAKKAVDEYGEALNKAKELLKKPDATQKEVDAALKTLNEKRAALDAYNTDTTKLKESVKKHGDTEGTAPTEGTQTSDAYRNASDPHFMKEQDGKLVPDDTKNNAAKEAKKKYDEALTKAQELLKKHGDANTPQDAKPTQKEINDALKTLDDARTEIEKYKTDTTALNTEAEKSKADTEGASVDGKFEDSPEFKNASYKQNVKPDTNPDVQQAKSDIDAYKKALANARKLVNDAKDTSKKNSERPTQKQIDDALETLKNAKQAITDGYKTDTSKLTEAKDYANGDFKKTPEYKNAEAIKADTNNANHEQAGKDLDGTDDNPGLTKLVEKITQKLQNAGNLTQREVDTLLKQLKGAQKKIAENYKTKTDKLENEVGDKDAQGQPVTPKFEESIPYKNALAKKNAESEDDAKKETSATKKLEDYNKKLKDAQDLIAQVNSTDPNADPDKKPTQKQVDEALAALKKAKKDIDDAFATNASDLKDEAAKSTADDATTVGKDDFEATTEYQNALAKKTDDGKDNADVDAYKKALKKARTLLEKFDDNGKPKSDATDIPTQKEVDEALKNLKEIKDKITKNYVTSPHDLQEEVDKSKDGKDDTSTDVFENTPEFKNATAKGDDAAKQALKEYNDKLKAARDLLNAFDRTTGKPVMPLPTGMTQAPTQQELDKALKELQDAKKKITDEYSTVKYDLRQEAGKDSDFTKSPEYQNAQAKGDDESKKALEDYKNALDEANSVLADPNATQAEVDAALKKLQDAKSKLKDENSTDKSKLQTEADDDAKFRKSLYFIIGNKADIEAYKKALAEAKSVLNDPTATQAQVDEALRKLKAAKYKLNHPFGAGSGSGIGSGYDTDADAGDGFDTSASQSASVDKSALQVEVNNAVNTNANTAEARAYRKALAEAKRVLADKNATQAQVDEALKKLKAAKSALLNSLRGASGNAGGLANTGAETGLFASIAAIFAGLGVAGVASRRRKHSNE